MQPTVLTDLIAHVGLHEVGDVGFDVEDVLEFPVAFSYHADL
jgi:hypothetical protein